MLCVAAKRRLILFHYNAEPFSAIMMTPYVNMKSILSFSAH